jgi:hypothetical protein
MTLANKLKGQAIGIGNQFLGLALGAILLIISVLIFAQVSVQIPVIGITSAANDTINTIISTTYSAFNLSVVALIVVAAAIIIGAAFLLVAGGRRR